MELTLAGNYLHEGSQTLSLGKVTTLIGENGSGKSSILQDIFKQKTLGKEYKNNKFVCFSSGQNENFSNDFLPYLNKTKSEENNLQLSCFYFDKTWARLLIFLATTLKKTGKVRKFLINSGYVTEKDDVDISTTLKISFRLDNQYVKKVQDALHKEARGDINSLRQTAFHRTLESFIDVCIQDGYDFEETIKKSLFDINQTNLLNVSFDTERFEPGEVQTGFDPEVGFFIRASQDSTNFLDRETSSLTFENNLELGKLSDGEYQILFLYALIDLFDDGDTVFILDEADSHLHYKNVERFWDVLSNIKGKSLSTTHLLDSIYCVGVDNIRILNKGKIHLPSESGELIDRLSQLSNIKKSEFKALTYHKKIVLIDDLNDWYIFKELYKQSRSAYGFPDQYYDQLFDSVAVIKVNSGWNTHNCKFAESKIRWVENFLKFCEGMDIKTESIYLLCDRDNLPLDGIGTDESPLIVQGVKVNGGKKIKTSVLAWRRREIKHYLLSKSALGDCVAVLNNHQLPQSAYLVEKENGDYLLDNRNGAYQFITEVKSMSHESTNSDIEVPIYNNYLASLPSCFVKSLLSPFIEEIEEEPFGFNRVKLTEFIANMKPEEISEDITNMYNFIIGKL